MGRRALKYTIVFFVLAVFVLLATQCHTTPKKEEPFFLNLNDTVDYVGIEKCRACHEDHYSTFIQTGMGMSFGPATLERSKASFANIKPIYDPKVDMYYYPFKENNSIKIMEFRLKGKDTIHKRIETISYIIGSGHHTNSHFWQDNGFLFQAPLTYYTQQGKWDLPPGFEETNTRFSRKIDAECMNCHNAISRVQNGAINKFTTLPYGIDCERCHGPGELHVNLKMKGEIVDVKKTADRSIVNPAKLPWKLQVDVCQRCHLQGNNVLKPGKNFTDFRPGMHLDSVFDVYMPKYPKGDIFFMAGHAGRLQMSRCFVVSNKNSGNAYNPKMNFTCITCHDPHVSVRKTNIQKFNNACSNCHSEKGNSSLKKCSEKESVLSKVNYNCVSCHMPANNTADIPHVTVHDHYIRRPSTTAQTNQTTEKPVGLYAVNSQNPEKNNYIVALITWFEKFDALKIYMDQAGNEIRKNPVPADIEIHYYYANQQLASILNLVHKVTMQQTDPWTCYRIAKAYDKSQETESALPWYKAALDKQRLNADFAAEYANALIRTARVKEARPLSEQFCKLQPKHVLSLVNLGACLSLDQHYSDARKTLEKAIALDPDNENARLYLAEVFLRVGEKSKALKELEEAIRIDPRNEGTKNEIEKLLRQ